MSQFKNKSVENILSLVPHIIEDYCRFRRRIMGVVNKNDILWEQIFCSQENNKKLTDSDDYNNLGVQQIHIEAFKKTLKEEVENKRKQKYGKQNFATSKSNMHFNGMYSTGMSRKKEIEMATRNLKIENSFLKRKHYNKTCEKILKQQIKENNKEEIFRRLSIPKCTLAAPTKEPWRCTSTMKCFVPSERLIELAQLPKRNCSLTPTLSEVLKVKRSALTYNATPRIQELAFPKAPCCSFNFEPDHFKVSCKALSANFSPRVSLLACPKERVESFYRKNPFKVKKRALYAKASRLTKELATPRALKSGF